MRPLAAVERFFERIFERPTARLFRARVQPVQIQRRLERAMESERLTASGRTLVPNRYAVHLNPADLAAFEDLAASLATDLADSCLAYARSRHYTVADRPQISLVPDESVVEGEFRVATHFARAGAPAGDAAAGEGRSPDPEPGSAAVDAPEGASGEGPFTTPHTPAAPEHTMVFEVPRVAAPRARLRLVLPDGAEREILIDGRPMTAGRGTDNDLVLRDGRVSRRHIRIQARSGSLILTDLGSTNGTRVNGYPVSEVALGEGDTIELGDSTLIVESAPEL